MAKHETVRDMTEDQRRDIIATMVTAMPSLDFDQAQAIIGSKGTFVVDIGKVFKRHTGKPVPAAQPSAEFTIGDRVYELVSPLEEGKDSVNGYTMVARALEFNANLGEEDGTFILNHQDEIPHELRGKIQLVFTAWRDLSDQGYVAYLGWFDGRWNQYWYWLGIDWDEFGQLVRRRPATNPA